MTITSALDEARAPTSGSCPHHIVGGIVVAALDRTSALATVRAAMAAHRHLKLAFCNANLVNLGWRDPLLRRALRGFLVLPDGIGIDLGARILDGASFPENLNGTDFVPALLAAERRPLRVALVGGRPGIGGLAAERLAQAYPRHRFSVLGHGFFAPEEEPELRTRLERDRPDLLLVAFGNPRQERWIASLDARHACVAAGVGALFDFLAGQVPRAPEPVRRLRLEWLYRLCREPARLWRRYMVGNPLFIARMIGLRLAGRHEPR